MLHDNVITMMAVVCLSNSQDRWDISQVLLSRENISNRCASGVGSYREVSMKRICNMQIISAVHGSSESYP